jgi:hypothetical protein
MLDRKEENYAKAIVQAMKDIGVQIKKQNNILESINKRLAADSTPDIQSEEE